MKAIHWFLLFTVIGCSRPAWSLETADEALAQAERLADRYQFGKALPLFMEAERKFLEAADKTSAAHARLGRIRSSVREFSLQQINGTLNKELKRPPVRDDAALRLRALFLKADLGTDIDSISAAAFNAEQRQNDWQEILTLSRKLGNKHLENRAQGELGLLKVLDGDALGSEEVSAALWHAVEIGDVMNELRFRTAIAGLYRGAGRAHDALGHLDRVIELAESEQALSYFPAYFEKAVNLIELHRLEKALPLISHCVGQAKITRSLANNAQALYLQGKIHRQKSRLPEAVDSLKQAINFAADADYHRLVSMASLDLSQIYRSRDDLWRALDSADSGLQASLKTGDPTEAIFHLQNKASVKTEQGRFTEADRLYGEALRALNALLEKFTSAYTRAFIVSRMSGLYSDYFSLCLIKLKQPAKAFEILEQARGRSISDSIQGRRTDPTSPGETNGANRFEKYERALFRLQAQLWTKKDPQELRRIQGEIFDLEQHLGSAQLAGRHNIEAQTYLPIPLAEVQKALYPGEVILEYVLREPFSTCLAISRENIQGFALAPRHVIEKSITDYREEILQGRPGTQMAHALYSHLMAPVSGLNQKQRITIIPDGLLHLLPFEAILMPSGRFLINSYMIDYSPSATVMMLLRKKPGRKEIRCRFLGVGDTRLSSSDESGDAFFANTLQPARLPGSRAEVLSIAKAMKDVSETVTMLGYKASESAIKALNLSSFDVLHFAVHGTSDVHFPARSALLFGPHSDEIEDGILQSWEISRLQLKADLVVLSACDTVVGRLLDQEGVSNLVQAFLLAGARSVVASIWPAEDRSAADLMMRFYSYLAQGMDKGSALRQAKLDFIEKYGDKALPIHWAGMLMIGDSSDSILGGYQGNDVEEEKR